MVMSLCGLEEVEDRNLLAGSLMVLLEQDYNQAQVGHSNNSVESATQAMHNRGCTLNSVLVGQTPQEGCILPVLHVAQELLLRSGRPLAALEMRQDLKHWPEALALAQRLAPDRVPALSKEHAAMLEMVGEYAEARSHYQQVRMRQERV